MAKRPIVCLAKGGFNDFSKVSMLAQNLEAIGESESVVALLSPAMTYAAANKIDDPALKSTLFS